MSDALIQGLACVAYSSALLGAAIGLLLLKATGRR